MSERQLRDLLARTVPEAPDVDAGEIRHRARVVRRQRLAAAGAVLATAAAVTVLAAVGLRGEKPPAPVALDPVPTAPSGSAAPYQPPTCPTRLPESVERSRTVPGLGDVEAVRLCPDLREIDGGRRGPVGPGAAELIAGMDALVTGIDALGDAIARLPAYGSPSFCDSASWVSSRDSLLVVREDGTTELLWVPVCEAVGVGGHRVYGHEVADAVREMLDRQRDELDYTRPFTGALTCAGPVAETPVRPDREDLVTGAFCESFNPSGSVDDDPEPLDAGQLDLLRRAWAEAEETPDDGDHDECTSIDDEAPSLVVGTDRSDVVRLFESPCGTLVWDGWRAGRSVTVPITFADLGIETRPRG